MYCLGRQFWSGVGLLRGGGGTRHHYTPCTRRQIRPWVEISDLVLILILIFNVTFLQFLQLRYYDAEGDIHCQGVVNLSEIISCELSQQSGTCAVYREYCITMKHVQKCETDYLRNHSNMSNSVRSPRIYMNRLCNYRNYLSTERVVNTN